MTSTRAGGHGGEPYEIVVPGVVGRAVCAALLPLRAATEHVTVLHTRLAPGRELADLVAALQARGLEVTRVEALD